MHLPLEALFLPYLTFTNVNITKQVITIREITYALITEVL